MTRFTSTFLAMLALGATWSERAEPPARVGNIWGGLNYEPKPAIVGKERKAQGVLPSPSQQERLNNGVERTARELLDNYPTARSSKRRWQRRTSEREPEWLHTLPIRRGGRVSASWTSLRISLCFCYRAGSSIRARQHARG